MSETEGDDVVGVRIITAAPEVDGVMHAITELDKRGVIFSIGHRYMSLSSPIANTEGILSVQRLRKSQRLPFEWVLVLSPIFSMQCLNYTTATLPLSVSSVPRQACIHHFRR